MTRDLTSLSIEALEKLRALEVQVKENRQRKEAERKSWEVFNPETRARLAKNSICIDYGPGNDPDNPSSEDECWACGS